MVVRGTSIIDVGGVAGCRNACEDKCGQELKHACKRRFNEKYYSSLPQGCDGISVV